MREKWGCARRLLPSIEVRNRLTRLETVTLAQNHLKSGKHSTVDVQTRSRRVDAFELPIDSPPNHKTSIPAKNSGYLTISAQSRCAWSISGGILCGKTSDHTHSSSADHHCDVCKKLNTCGMKAIPALPNHVILDGCQIELLRLAGSVVFS